jgi:D-amino peptidase
MANAARRAGGPPGEGNSYLFFIWRKALRVFISADIEGTCGITHWDETDAERGGKWYEYFRTQMTREVTAACEGASEGGATTVTVKDAHDSGRNIRPSELPAGVKMGRGWSGSFYSMVDGIQDGYDALVLTGYHSAAASEGSPLAHTMTRGIAEVLINGMRASEFLIYGYAAAELEIPVIFISGDAALCDTAREVVPAITAVSVNVGKGYAVTAIHPDEAVALIKAGVKAAVKGYLQDPKACVIKLPPTYMAEVRYTTHAAAFRASRYPGAELLVDNRVGITHTEYNEILRFFSFVL